METDRELAIPPVAQRDPSSLEVVRVWIAEGNQHLSIRTSVWDDPAAWGILLADLARHVATAVSIEHSVDQREVLSRVIAGWEAEFASPPEP